MLLLIERVSSRRIEHTMALFHLSCITLSGIRTSDLLTKLILVCLIVDPTLLNLIQILSSALNFVQFCLFRFSLSLSRSANRHWQQHLSELSRVLRLRQEEAPHRQLRPREVLLVYVQQGELHPL